MKHEPFQPQDRRRKVAVLSCLLLLALAGCEPPRVAGTYEGRVAVLNNALVRMSFETNGLVLVTVKRVESRTFVTTNQYAVVKNRLTIGTGTVANTFIIVNRDTIRDERKPDLIFRRMPHE